MFGVFCAASMFGLEILATFDYFFMDFQALLELLDQVESAITVEEPASELLDQVENVATVEEPAFEHLDQVQNAITVEEPASERLDQVKNAVTVEEPTSEVLEQVENAITVEEPAVELLDRVENAITFEEPALVESNTSSSRHCSNSDEISVKANSPIKETAMNSLEEANVSSSDPCFLVLEVRPPPSSLNFHSPLVFPLFASFFFH